MSDRLVAPDFVINCVEVRNVQFPEIRKSYIIALIGFEAADGAQNVTVNKARGKENDQQNPCDIAAYITKLLQMSEDSNNPV